MTLEIKTASREPEILSIVTTAMKRQLAELRTCRSGLEQIMLLLLLYLEDIEEAGRNKTGYTTSISQDSQSSVSGNLSGEVRHRMRTPEASGLGLQEVDTASLMHLCYLIFAQHRTRIVILRGAVAKQVNSRIIARLVKCNYRLSEQACLAPRNCFRVKLQRQTLGLSTKDPKKTSKPNRKKRWRRVGTSASE